MSLRYLSSTLLNLVCNIDASNTKSVPSGCAGYVGAKQVVFNSLSPGDTIQLSGIDTVTGFDYYTVFAIDYPETTYGGDATGHDGILVGYNVRSNKLYDYSRALNMHVFNHATRTWIDDSCFNGWPRLD